MAYLIPALILMILIILNGIFVAAEFAIVATAKTRIKQFAEDGSSTAGNVLRILDDPDLQNRYITTAQVGITIVSLGLGMYGESVLAEWILDFMHPIIELDETTAHTIALILAVGLLTYLHVVIGEMIPKSLALQSAEATSMALYQPMNWLEKLFFPLVWFLNIMGNWVIRLLKIPPPDVSDRLHTSEELEYIVGESSQSGLIDPSELLFIENILDLEERSVEQAMTPRNRIHSTPIVTAFS